MERIGINGRLDTIQAAVLLAKLDAFDDELTRRADIADAYDAAMPDGVQSPVRVPNSESAWAIYAVLLRDRHERDSLQVFLKNAGIPTAVYYPKPLHHQPAYAEHHDGASLPVSEGLGERVLALPIHPELTDQEVKRVTDAVVQWAEQQAS